MNTQGSLKSSNGERAFKIQFLEQRVTDIKTKIKQDGVLLIQKEEPAIPSTQAGRYNEKKSLSVTGLFYYITSRE